MKENDPDADITEASPVPEVSEIPYDERPPLNRPVHVDALLDNWRTQIRNAGIEAEEKFLSAVNEIFNTEKEREEAIARNMVLELNNTVEAEMSSLENSVIYLAKRGKASGKDDPRYKELNEKIVASGKKIRNHAVDIRYGNKAFDLPQKLSERNQRTIRSQNLGTKRYRLENDG